MSIPRIALSCLTVAALFGASLLAHAQDAGAPDAGAPDAGASTPIDVDAGTDSGVSTPWASTQDVVPLPSFLDTTDRRIRDDRPPPSAEQVAALREMEAEVDRFTKSGTSYRSAIVSILRREYLQRRRDREQGYARQIREEERLQNEARERAIRLFERFVRRYPNDPTYTPDAMFRLGELYYERSAIAYQDASEIDPAATEGHPDFYPTIETYRTLVQRFPNYRRIDGVYYLIGYCLNEMGLLEEAVQAWLNLVCANHFTYTGAPTPTPTDETPEEGADPAAEHPALALDPPPPPQAPDAPFVDPYVDCTPVMEGAEFISETWLRIGEYHFDFDTQPHFLERAISAYQRVLVDPTDRNYNLALYKIAWAYYRASRYPEALEHFAMLIQWSDDEEARTGRAGSELRAEAVQYIGITLAYDDWNEDQVPDPQEGMPRGIERLQDASLVPQDRAWTPEVYFGLGQVYFDEAKYNDAIEVWQLFLSRWPNHARVPEAVQAIARAYGRQQRLADQIEWQSRCADYGEGSDWWDANREHPVEQRDAEECAEGALINAAIRHHQEAQRLRRRAVEEQDEAMLQSAIAEYNLAAQAYREYIEHYPNSPQAYELQYNLADALYWSGQYEDAAQAYAAVRDSNLDDQYLSDAARRVVESLKRLQDEQVARHEIEIREEPPTPEGTPPRVTAIEMPQMVQRVAQAREIYLARVDDAHDTEHLRASYFYNNTLLLYRYGYWDQARERFRQIYLERCGQEESTVAWQNLYNIALALGDQAEVERLSQDQLQRSCTAAPGQETGTPIDCRNLTIDCNDPANADNPTCIACGTLTNLRFRRALELYQAARGSLPEDQLCPATPTAEQVQQFEQSASDMLSAVNDEPNHADAPRALIYAAVALECTSRFESASRIYERVINEVGPRRSDDAEQQRQLDRILAQAYFRLAYTANRFFDYDRAIQNYRILADSSRFARATDEQIVGSRQDALINAARIFEYQQDYAHASEYYRRAAESLGNSPPDQRSAYYRVAEMAYRRRDWAGTIREMQAFMTRYRGDADAGELLVQAAWRIAEARLQMHQTREYRAALQDVVDTFSRSGQQPGSIAAEYAANARFLLADDQIQDFESWSITAGRPATLEAYVNSVRSQIQAGGTRASGIAAGYEPVLQYRRPTWTIAAYVRQGRTYEILARAILNTPFVMPDDLARRTRGASQEVRDEVRVQVEDRIRQLLDEQVRPVECLAIVRYALAARAARAGSLDNEYTRIAVDRLQAYGDERIAECIAAQQAQDASFTAYTPGEFQRARRGQTLPMEPGRASPELAPED